MIEADTKAMQTRSRNQLVKERARRWPRDQADPAAVRLRRARLRPPRVDDGAALSPVESGAVRHRAGQAHPRARGWHWQASPLPFARQGDHGYRHLREAARASAPRAPAQRPPAAARSRHFGAPCFLDPDAMVRSGPIAHLECAHRPGHSRERACGRLHARREPQQVARYRREDRRTFLFGVLRYEPETSHDE